MATNLVKMGVVAGVALTGIGLLSGDADASVALHQSYQPTTYLNSAGMPAKDVSQAMAIHVSDAYVARKRSGKNQMYIEKVNLNNGSKHDLGNRDIGHGNGMTVVGNQLYVTRTGGSNVSGNNVNVYNITGNTITFSHAYNVYDAKNRKVNISAMSWDSSHHRMIYAANTTLYVANSTNPSETHVTQVAGHMTDQARYDWVKTRSGVSQGILASGSKHNLYYTRGYNTTPGRGVNIGNKTYVGTVNLDKLVNNHKIVQGSEDAMGSYKSGNSIFEIEGLAQKDNRIYFNTTNMTNKFDRNTNTDFIAYFK